MSAIIKENSAQRVERIKKEKSGLDVLEDIYEYAIFNKELNPEDIDRFKWYGLYAQNKTSQDADDATQYFMLRVKLVQGSITVDQMKVLAGISQEFARDTASFTTRQDLQFHFIQVRDLPEIFYRLKNVGLRTVFAAGDVPRNIVTCPVSGVDKQEIYDTRDLVFEVHDYFKGNRSLANLPRKFKVGISGCSKHCMGHEIQDLSFTAVKCRDGQILFDVSVGGGLASNKQFANHIGYVMPEQILEIVKAVSITYRDYGLRESRKKARLGHLINKWGIEKFKATIEKSVGFKLADEVIQEYTPSSKREHFGIHPSKKYAKVYIGCAINGGFIGARGLKDLSNIMQKYDASGIKATSTQNFVILDVSKDVAHTMVYDLKLIGIDANPSPFKARTISCTGIKYCKFAISETKDTAIALVSHLQEKFPHFDETVTISVNGCPNSCAHPNIVDIGLLGMKFKNDEGETVSGFEIVLGGNLEGSKSTFGEKMKLKIIADEVNEVVENIINKYIKSGRKNIQSFFKDMLHGEEFSTYKLK